MIGSGKIAIVENGDHVSVKIGLKILPSMGGAILFMLAILVALLTLGLSLMIYWLMRDNAAEALVVEFDRVAAEIEKTARLTG